MSRKETKRQLVHAIFGTGLIGILFFFGKDTSIILGSLALGFGMIISALIKLGYDIPFFAPLVRIFGRQKEKIPGLGAMHFFLGMLFAIIIFEKDIAVGAMIVAVYGDAASTIIGSNFGKTKVFKEYSLEGTLAGIIVSFLALLFFFKPLTAFAAATAGMVTELLPIDDNLTIPLVSGAVLLVLV